jgi:PilZ domain
VAKSHESTPEIELTWPSALAGEVREWVTRAIAQGALQEREECAKLAEAQGAAELAASIRSRPAPALTVRALDRSPPGARSPTAPADKRASPRTMTEGRMVTLIEVGASANAFAGRLIDYSEGGLGILVERPVSQSIFLDASPAEGPETSPAARLQVRYCISTGTGWRIGCQFVSTPRQIVMALVGLSPPRPHESEG